MTINDEISGTLIKNQTPAVAYGIPGNWIGRAPENGGNAVEPMVDVAPCQTVTDQHAVAYSIRPMNSGKPGQGYPAVLSAPTYGLDEEQNGAEELMGTLKARKSSGGHQFAVASAAMQVRRLTPTECERLQGFPDGYTDIKPKGKPTPDGPRYKALGNSWAVPNVRWIGERIDVELKKC